VLKFSETELAEALNYSQTAGLPILIQKLRQFAEREHNPSLQANDWSLMVTNGSQDGICKAMEALVSEGDYILVEKPSYAGAIEILRGLNAKFIEVPTDQNGLIPELLEEAIQKHRGKRPRILYTVPTGQNPGGTTLTTERKHKVVELANKYDFLILEDDPYYFLYYGLNPAPPEGKDADFRVPPIKSLFSLDKYGRVLRFESFSKVMSSGLRLGVVMGPNHLVERIERHQEVGPLHVSGVTQTIAAKVLQYFEGEKWLEHTRQVALFYARRRDWFAALCKKHLTGLAEWNVPSAGMFFWIKLLNVTDSFSLINEKARTAKVLLVPGQVFSCYGEKSPYVRASFSAVTPADADIAIGRLAELLKKEKASA